MSPKEREILMDTLNTLEGINFDFYNYNRSLPQRYNYEIFGRVVLALRALAEILGLDINDYLFPGESRMRPDDDPIGWRHFYPMSSTESLSLEEKLFLKDTVLPMLDNLMGVQDYDNSSIRVMGRRLAEVAGYPDLSRYPVYPSKGSQPQYFKEYIAI